MLDKKIYDLDLMYKEKQWLIDSLGKDKLNQLFTALDNFEKEQEISDNYLIDVISFRHKLLRFPSMKS